LEHPPVAPIVTQIALGIADVTMIVLETVCATTTARTIVRVIVVAITTVLPTAVVTETVTTIARTSCQPYGVEFQAEKLGVQPFFFLNYTDKFSK